MTSLRQCDQIGDLNAVQLGLIARAIDVHRQAQVRKLGRTASIAERTHILDEIDDLAYTGALFKRAELERLRSDE